MCTAPLTTLLARAFPVAGQRAAGPGDGLLRVGPRPARGILPVPAPGTHAAGDPGRPALRPSLPELAVLRTARRPRPLDPRTRDPAHPRRPLKRGPEATPRLPPTRALVVRAGLPEP